MKTPEIHEIELDVVSVQAETVTVALNENTAVIPIHLIADQQYEGDALVKVIVPRWVAMDKALV